MPGSETLYWRNTKVGRNLDFYLFKMKFFCWWKKGRIFPVSMARDIAWLVQLSNATTMWHLRYNAELRYQVSYLWSRGRRWTGDKKRPGHRCTGRNPIRQLAKSRGMSPFPLPVYQWRWFHPVAGRRLWSITKQKVSRYFGKSSGQHFLIDIDKFLIYRVSRQVLDTGYCSKVIV